MGVAGQVDIEAGEGSSPGEELGEGHSGEGHSPCTSGQVFPAEAAARFRADCVVCVCGKRFMWLEGKKQKQVGRRWGQGH